MQQAQGKRSLVVRAQGLMCFLEELSQIGAQLDNSGGLTAAGGAGFEEDAVGDFAGVAEALRVGEAVVAPEPADRLALRRDKGERGVGSDRIPEPLEFPVDGVLAEHGLEGEGIEKNIDVFRKPLDQVPAFRQGRADLEDDLVGSCGGDDAQRHRDVVILLDKRRAQFPRGEVLLRAKYRLLEILVLKKLHVSAAPWPASCERAAARPAGRSRTARRGSGNRAGGPAPRGSCQVFRRWRRASRRPPGARNPHPRAAAPTLLLP